jgi:hypothetical protein
MVILNTLIFTTIRIHREFLMILAFILFLIVPATGQSNYGLHMSTYFKYATVENIDASDFTGLTIEGWINIDQYMPFGDATGNPIFVKEPTFSSPYYNYGFILMVLNEQHYQGHYRRLAFGLNFGEYGDTHIGLHSDHEVPLHEWHHLAGTWDGSNMKVYIDGVLDGTYDVSALGPFYDPASLMHFGARLMGNQYAFHFGDIDDARIWDYARSESEIRETMYKEITGSEPGLYACYQFNETSGQTLTDLGPNGLDGYLGSTSGSDYYDADRVSSTAPIPYYSVQNGNWNDASTWAGGQLAPATDWAIAALYHEVTLGSDVTVEDLTIETGGVCIVNPLISLTVPGTLTNNAGYPGLIIKSDATGTGSLIEYSGADATAERYFTDSCWHYVSSPVDDPTAAVFLGMYLKRWNEPAGTWNYIMDENEVLATDMEGYALWTYNAGTAVFTGPLNTGPKTLTVTHQGPIEDNIDDGYNFAGNPYPSSLDWNVDDGNGWTRTAGNVYNTLWIWNPQYGNYGVYIKDFLMGTNDVDNIIPPHQGFFVYCSQPEGYISVDDGARIHSSEEILKSAEQSFPAMKLKVEGASGSDEILLNLQPGTSSGFDPQTDALKIKGNAGAPQLFTLSTGKDELTINTFPQTEEYRVIPLCFEPGQTGSFTLSSALFSGFEPGTEIVVEDLQNGKFTSVEDETELYSFTSVPGDEALRFLIHLDGQPAVPPAGESNEVSVYSFGQDVYIKSPATLDGSVTVYDPSGRELMAATLSHDLMKKIHIAGYFGVAAVRVVTQQGLTHKKVFIN